MVSAADVVVTAAIIAALRADLRMTLVRCFPIAMFPSLNVVWRD
jgi:hypothetical protein